MRAMAGYFVAMPQGQQGPFPASELVARGVRPDMLVWTEGMADWRPAGTVGELSGMFPYAAPPPPPQVHYAPPGYAGPTMVPPVATAVYSDKKLAAGLCAIFIGSFGIHKFILGYTGAGVIMLLATVLSCGVLGIVMHVISIIEGIIYLTKSDAEFVQTYVQGRKEWF